jgi:hypothetical protein
MEIGETLNVLWEIPKCGVWTCFLRNKPISLQ